MKNLIKQKINVRKSNQITPFKKIIQTPENKILNKLQIKSFSNISPSNPPNSTKITVRIRPLNDREKDDSDYKTIKVISKKSLIISIPTEYSFDEKGSKKIHVVKEKQSKFDYDFVFDEKADQQLVYKHTSANLISQVLDGFNATIFAYGATGTGKTYTMLGEGGNTGIMIRVIKDLFMTANSYKNKKFGIKISYIEIYNEIIRDLLSIHNYVVELKTDPKKGLILKNAFIKKLNNENEAFDIILNANKNRNEKITEYNNNSSRSHAILNIYIDIEEQDIDENKNNNKKSFGKFMLLDLAGCEKTSFNYNSKGNKELGSINKSLLALTKCINILTSKKKNRFIPWRESNLTRILQEPLSGNSNIVMIATISMSLTSFDETMYTLQYAKKAKNLKICLKKNIDEKNTLKNKINKYDKFIENIKQEINDVKNDIKKQELIIEKKEDNINHNISYINNKIQNEESNININEKNENFINNSFDLNNKYDSIYKEMVDHFQKEINLKRKIIEKEDALEELKDKLTEKEYEIFIAPNIEIPTLKQQWKDKKSDIDDKSRKLMNGYIKQNELISKRKEYQKIISSIYDNDPNNPEYYKLYNIYRYNVNLLDNMTIEHKKFMSIRESKRKDKKIEGLMNQIDIRDKYIRDAYEQIEKNDIEFNYKNPNLIRSNDLENIFFQPKIIKIETTKDNYKSFIESRKSVLKSPNFKNDEEKSMLINNKGNLSKILFLKKLTIKNDLNDKTELKETINASKLDENKQNKSELLSLLKAKKQRLNINDFIRRKNDIFNKRNSLHYNNKISLNNDLKSLSLSPIQRRPTIKSLKSSGPFSQKFQKNNFINYNSKGINGLSQKQNKSMISKLETEIQKKIKTILKKNYIARYEKSPFLKILDE